MQSPPNAVRDAPDGLTIRQVAQRTGLSEHNLRFYERVGLLRPVGRAASSGHRRYHEPDLEWIRFLNCLRATHMPVAGMREYAELAIQGDRTAPARERLLTAHRANVIEQIAELNRCVGMLDYKLSHFAEIERNLNNAEQSSESPHCLLSELNER